MTNINDICEELNWAIAKENLPFFVEHILGYTVKPYHKEWLDDLTGHHRNCIVSARGHGKSSIVSIGYSLWVMCCNPQINPLDKPDKIHGVINNNTLIFSNKEDQAEDIINKIRIETEENDYLQSLSWIKGNKSLIGIKERGNRNTIKAAGFGSSVRGRHDRVVIVDDPLAERNLTNDEVHDFFFNALTPMMLDDGYVQVVGTRFRYDDLYATLSEPERGYNYKEYPCLDVNNNPLWIERYPYSALMNIKAQVGNLSFAREFLCQPIDSSSSLFPMDILEAQKTNDCFEQFGDGVHRYITAVDLARGAKSTSDYFVALTMKKEGTVLKIANIFRKQGMGFREQLAKMSELHDKFHPTFTYIENNNYQFVMEQLLSSQMIPVRGRTTGRQNKENSIFLVRSMLEHSNLELPFGNTETREIVNDLIYELAATGFKNDKVISLSRHDDLSTALCMACEAFSLFRGVEGSGAVNNFELPLDISGGLDVDLSLPWLSDNFKDLGIQ